MAFTVSTNKSRMTLASESYTLPSSATTEYSSVLPKGIEPFQDKTTNYVTFSLKASAVTGTNLDIALYGSDTEAGTTKFLLKDALVADITDGTLADVQLDMNLYPALYYFVGWTADADEDANTIALKIYH